jgi:hypothetical protein
MIRFFRTKKEKDENCENCDYFKLLIAIAYKDGDLNAHELDILCKIGIRLGLGTNLITQLINNHKEHYVIELPTDPYEKFDQLFDLISIMLADDEIKDEEIDFCVNIAKKLNFDIEIVGALVRRIFMGIESGKDKEIIRNEALDFLNN